MQMDVGDRLRCNICISAVSNTVVQIGGIKHFSGGYAVSVSRSLVRSVGLSVCMCLVYFL